MNAHIPMLTLVLLAVVGCSRSQTNLDYTRIGASGNAASFGPAKPAPPSPEDPAVAASIVARNQAGGTNPDGKDSTTATRDDARASPDGTTADASFNDYIIQAVEIIYAARKRGGYDAGATYSQDLDYGNGKVQAQPKRAQTEPPPRRRTMCVAAAGEVMIEAINLYVAKTGDRSPYQLLPAGTWNEVSLLSFKPYLFLHDDVRRVYKYKPGETPRGRTKEGKLTISLSRGTGHAMSIFHIGEELPFSALRKGDFMNFNRNGGSGHAAIFISYIDKDNKYTSHYSPDVIGFQYFSAQGRKKPDAGFEYRDTYFSKTSPATTAGGHVRDSAIRSNNLLLLNGGRMWAPPKWNVALALDEIQKRVDAVTPKGIPRRAATINEILEAEMPPSAVDFSGEEEG